MKISVQVILLLFTLIVLAHNLRVPATYLYYYTATEDFIERLCENKDRPELNCDGQCYLAKMLQQNGDDANPLPKEHITWPENLLFWSEASQTPSIVEDHIPELNGIYLNSYKFVLPLEFFHPPNTHS